jgi:hypothetical protein
MNASVSALNREGEVQSKIGKVRAFGRIARIVCSAIFGFGLVGSVGVFLIGILGIFLPNLRGGADFTPEQRMSALPMAAMVVGVWLAALYQLYRLFGNLAAGAIYTPENVRRVRNVGFLWLLLAAFSILIPVASTALNAFGIAVTKSALAFSLSESLSAFAAAGLILLASWIMDVGLFEKDHAEALQRDADLVI